jgi:hypothetical protein
MVPDLEAELPRRTFLLHSRPKVTHQQSLPERGGWQLDWVSIGQSSKEVGDLAVFASGMFQLLLCHSRIKSLDYLLSPPYGKP